MRKLPFLLLLLASGFGLLAQDPEDTEEIDLTALTLEELLLVEVISASKTSEKLTDAPGVIQVITSEEISRFGALNLAEVLDRVTGAINMGSYINPQSFTSIRGDLSPGGYDTHVLLLFNGRPMRESIHGGFNSPIYLGLPVSIIDKIEVIRGPGSVLYGSNAYMGVINILTKEAEETSGAISFTGGSFETLAAEGSFSVTDRDLALTGAFKSFNEAGWNFEATDVTNDSRSTDFLEDVQSFALTSSYKNLSANFFTSESEQRSFSLTLPVWVEDSLADPEDKRVTARRTLLDLGYELEFGDKLTANLNLTYNSFDTENNQRSNVPASSSDYLVELSNYYQPVDNLNIVVGGTIYKQTGSLVPSTRYDRNWYSTYIQVDYRPIEKLKLIAGGQYNSIGPNNDDFVPRVGAIFNITESFGAKVLYAQSFRAPYSLELNTTVPENFPVNFSSELIPEKLENIDIQLFYAKNKFEVYATYFDYTISDAISQSVFAIPNGPPVFFTVNLSERSGLLSENQSGFGYSVEGKYVPNDNFYFTGSYSHQENEIGLEDDPGGGNDPTELENVTYMPNDMVKLGISYRSTSNAVVIGLFNSYFSAFNDDRNEVRSTSNLELNDPLSDFNLLSLNVSLNLPKLFKASMKEEIILSVYGTNILNQDVNFPDFTSGQLNSFPGRPGSAWYGTLTVKF